MVNWENYEEYMLLLADGELDEAGKAALMAFVAQHPELKKELALYEATRMAPDMEVVYAYKSQLKKQAPAKAVALRSWWAYSAAAGVAIIIAFLAMRNNEATREVARNTPVDTVMQVRRQPEAPAPIKQPQSPQQQQLVQNDKHKQPATNNQQPVTSIKQPAQRTPDLIASLPTNVASTVSATETVTNPSDHTTSLTQVIPAQNEPNVEDQKFLAWLPIADEKKQGLNDMKDAVDNTIKKMQQIKETSVVIKIGNKNLLAFNL